MAICFNCIEYKYCLNVKKKIRTADFNVKFRINTLTLRLLYSSNPMPKSSLLPLPLLSLAFFSVESRNVAAELAFVRPCKSALTVRTEGRTQTRAQKRV